MSAHTLNPEELAAAARAALERTVDTKVDAVRTLVEKSAQAEHAEERAAAARTALEAAWTAALGTGWSERELRGLGLAAPGQPRARVSRKRRTADAPSAPSSEG